MKYPGFILYASRLVFGTLTLFWVTGLSAQCPTLTGPGFSQTGNCVGDVVTLTMSGGTNLTPGTQTVDWYSSNTPTFTPPNQGTYVGSAAINGSPPAPCTQPPIVLGALVNPCTAASNTGPNPGSEENEAILIWSGSGFNVSDFGAQVNNNIGTPGQDNIGVLGGCSLLSVPTVPVSGSCAFLAGPGMTIPPNAFVMVFTSSLADLAFDVSAACALGFPVYILQSSCARGTSGNVAGALNNGSGGPYLTVYGCPGPGQTLVYAGVGGNNTSTAGWTLGVSPVLFPVTAPCNAFPALTSPPTVPPNPVTIDPLDYTLQPSDCPGPLYFSAVPSPLPGGCPPGPASTTPFQVDINCPTVAIVTNASPCAGVANSSIVVQVLGAGGTSFVHDIVINGVPLGSFSTTSNPFVIPWTPPATGNYSIEVTSTVDGCPAAPVLSGITVIAGAPSSPLSGSFCVSEQPIDLSALEDPIYPGGTWSGPNVTGSTFDAGPTASGAYTISYTPPTGTGCVGPGDATITIQPGTAATPLPITVCETDQFEDLSLYEDPNFPNGTWSGYNVVSGNSLIGPHAVGTYSLTYTPPAGQCALPGSASLTVTAATPVGFTQPSITVCAGTSIDILNFVSPGVPTTNLVITGPFLSGTIATIPGGFSGVASYDVEVVGAGCYSPGVFSVNVNVSLPTAPVDGTVCESDGIISLTTYEDPFNPGLAWSGPFVTNGLFDATTAGPGNYTLTYGPASSAPPQCLGPGTMVLTVESSTPLTLIPGTVCNSASSFDLNTLLPPGAPPGTWSGNGVTGSVFDPSAQPAGPYVATFIPDPGLCTTQSTATVTIQPVQPPTLATATACLNGGLFDLETLFVGPIIPGTWTGNGVSGTFLDLALVGQGVVGVTFTPATGCASAASTSVTIQAGGTPTLGTTMLCVSSGNFDLTTLQDPAFPVGTWAGPGVVGSTFSPGLAGAGNATLTFQPTGPCFGTGTTVITVTNTISLTLGIVDACINGPPVDLSTLEDPLATGGSWSGPNVLNGFFTPTSPGVFSITYTPPTSACASGTATTAVVNNATAAQPQDGNACETDGLIDLSGFEDPANPGLNWSGAFVNNGFFDVTTAGPGTYTLTYGQQLNNPPQCTSPGTMVLTIDPNAPVTLSAGTACSNGGLFDLETLFTGPPLAGTWTGQGVSGSFLDLGAVSSGPIAVTFTPTGGCATPASTVVTVQAGGSPSLTQATICIAQGLFDLTTLQDPSYPSGIWSGPGVVGTSFDPAVSGIGLQQLTFTPSGTCFSSTSTTVDVVQAITLTLGTQTACAGDPVINLLSLEDPIATGGTWSGPGVAGTSFDPSTQGTFSITYTPPTSTCAFPSSTTISVSPTSSPSLQTGTQLCTSDSPFDLSTLLDPAFPTGAWSGVGVSGSMFDPAAAGAGTAILLFTPSSPCAQASVTQIVVSVAGNPVLASLDTCSTAGAIPLQLLEDPQYPGGIWSGLGVTGNVFSPQNLTAGTYTLTYSPAGTCSSPTSTLVNLTDPVVVGLNSATFCSDDQAYALDQLVPGNGIDGIWSGPAVASNSFDVGNAPIGQSTLTFTPGPETCALPATTTVTVFPRDAPQFSNLSLCQSSPVIDFSSLIPPDYTGGTWTGPFNNGQGFFDPSLAAANTSYTFSFDSPGNCAPVSTLEVSVSTAVSIAIAPLSFCESSSLIDLSDYDPLGAPGGVWSGPGVSGNQLDITATGTGNFTLSYSPPSGSCAVGDVPVDLMISPLTTVGIFADTVCASAAPIDLSGLVDPTFATGSWSGAAVTAAGVFTPTNFDGPQSVTFTPQAGCYTDTEYTFNLVGVSPPVVSAPTFVCAPDGLSYTAEVQLDYAGNSGQIQTDLGLFNGTLLVVAGLLSGSSPLATIDDEATCNDPITIPLGFTCTSVNCITDAGTLTGGPYELCEDEMLSPNAAVGFINDGNDTLVYVLDTDNDPNNGFLARGPNTAFGAPQGNLGQTMFVYAWAGNSDGLGGISPTDTCADLSNSLRVRWNASGLATTSAPSCNPANTTYTFDIVFTGGTAPFLQTSGPTGTFSPDGRTFSVDPVPSGSTALLTFTDVLGCSVDTINVTFSCSSTGCVEPDPGSFPAPPLTLCNNFISDGGYNFDQVLGQNDVQVWVIYADAAASVELGRVTSLPVDFSVFANVGETVYIASLAGENDGTGGVSTTCFALSNLRAISLNNQVQMPVVETLCTGDFLEFGGVIFDETNPSGTATLPGSAGACDTLVVVQLDFTSSRDTIRVFETICNDNFAFVGGRQFSINNPSDTFATGSGACDTLYMVDLTFGVSTSATIEDTLCIGEALNIAGLTFDEGRPRGTVTIDNAVGCDSTILVDLVFIERSTLFISGPEEWCNPDEISLEITVTGDYDIIGEASINGVFVRTEQLQPGTNQLTYPTSGDFDYSFNNIQVLGGCGRANVGSLFYSPLVSRVAADIPLPPSGTFVACGTTTVTNISAVPNGGIAPYSYLWNTGVRIASIEDVPAGTYQVFVTDAIGCRDTASVTVIEADTVPYTFVAADPPCADGFGSIAIELDQLPTGLSYRFDLPGIQPVTTSSFNFTDLEEGTYVFQLIQANGCEQSQLFVLDDPPQLNMLKDDTLTINLGDTVSLLADVPADLVSFQWTPPTAILCDTCPRTVAAPVRDITYFADLVTADGCIVTDQIFIQVQPVADIFIPTAFSPNGDATNDVFVPYGGPEVERIEGFYVFNRWGELLYNAFNFSPGDQNAGWDGTFKGRQMNPGVFVGMVQVRFRDGTQKTFTGDVLLMR